MIKSSKFKKNADDALQFTLKEASGYKNTQKESSIVTITDLKRNIHSTKDIFCKISKYTRGKLIGRESCIINLVNHFNPQPNVC
jgi:hypothetical protein